MTYKAKIIYSLALHRCLWTPELHKRTQVLLVCFVLFLGKFLGKIGGERLQVIVEELAKGSGIWKLGKSSALKELEFALSH